jgi:O-antigen ligase
VTRILGTILFSSLLALIALTAIPYGTAHVWWKALFVAVVFALAIVWIIELSLSQSWFTDGWSVILPVLALALFSLLQTLPVVSRSGSTGISLPTWNTISFDPYMTRFFVLQLLALTLSGVFLFRYASTERRLRILINVVIAVAVVSAIFGILRQTMQHGKTFGLPFSALDVGYGQFINRNHFAFLMEMGFGLSLGMILGGAKKDQVLIYFAAILPIWTALVLCGSRGGLVAMLAQVIIAALLLGMVWRNGHPDGPRSRALRIGRSLPVRVVLLLVLVGGILFGTLWLGGDRLATKIEESRSELEADNTTDRQGVKRSEVWRATWRMFSAHPILGVGMNGYWIAVPTYHDASGTMTPQEAHNDYLELLASGGVVGLAVGVWFAVAVFRRTRENLGSPNRFRRAACFGAAVGIAGVAVHSLVDFGLHMMVNALVFTTLIVIATSKPQSERNLAIEHE